jgi:hypothetical protein
MTQPGLHFDGQTYEPEQDQTRLTTQFLRVKKLLLTTPGRKYPPAELCRLTGTNALQWASVSARVRDLRKPRFGGWDIRAERVRRGEWVYWWTGGKA